MVTRRALEGAHVAPSTGRARWSLPLNAALRLFLVLLFSFSSPVFAVKVIKKGTGPYYKIPFKAKWVSKIKKGKLFRYKRKEFASPRIYKDRLFVGSDNGFFYALRQKSGHKLWRFKASGPIHSIPVFDDDVVYFGDTKGVLYALTIKDGKELWRFDQTGSEILAAPAVSGDLVYFSTLEGKLFALSRQSGEKIWEASHPLNLRKGFTIRNHSGPLIHDGVIYIGFADGLLAAYRENDGLPLWEKNLATGEGPFFDVDMVPLIDEGRLYAASFQGELICLDLAGKKTAKKSAEPKGVPPKILWQQQIGSGVSFAVQGETIFVSGSNGTLYALNKATGVKVWEKQVGEGALSAPVVSQSTVIVASTEKQVYFVNTANGDIKAGRFAKKGVFSDPVVAGDIVYYLSNGGRFYALKIVY
ncbi:MAG: PQQ-binding-like beta-propeller repeat protein [Deltaproteobacteria bacterium]|nr:PQQ-binding-like beta-propeller repeat protein [Deltaproteobacteria bacterium]